MQVSEIENGVPVPTVGDVLYRLVVENCKRMQVGHSFTVTGDLGEKLSKRGINGALKKLDNEYFVKTSGADNQFRVWRIL